MIAATLVCFTETASPEKASHPPQYYFRPTRVIFEAIVHGRATVLSYAACKVGIASIAAALSRRSRSRSYLVCSAGQSSGPLPHSFPSRSAVSGNTDARSVRMA